MARLSQRVSGLKVGNGLNEDVTQGPLINGEALAKVERHVSDAAARGAKVVAGGKRHSLGGTFYEPTVLMNVTSDMLVHREETFGPVAAVCSFNSEADIIEKGNDTPYGLAAYVYARDLGRVFRVAESLEYGVVAVNVGVFSTELAPFGGLKESGIGREGSRHGIEEFTEMKYMLLGGL